MALPVVADLKAVLRIEHAAEDTLLTRLLAVATADVVQHLRVPITAVARTFPDVRPLWDDRRQRWVLHVPLVPVATDPAVVVTDADDAVVDAATYRVDERAGVLVPLEGETPWRWSSGPYTIAATVGLSAHPEYGTDVEPILGNAILDLSAERWHNRNPTAQAEGAGGGVYTQRSALQGLPPRIVAQLAPFRVLRV